MVLTAMREGAKRGISKFILFGFMGMAVGGLVLMDVGGFFSGRNIATGSVVTIGRDKMTAAEFDRLVRRTLARQGMDVQTAWQLGLIDQILNAEVSASLLTRAAADNGLRVGDETVAKQVAEIVTPYVDGQTTRKQALQRILMSQGMGEAEFVGAIRQEMTNNILRTAILMAAGVGSEAEARDLYQYTFERRSIDALILPVDKGLDVPPANDDILRPFYQAGQEKYAIPETRSLTVAVLSESAIKDSVKVTEDDLKAQYETLIEGYRIPEKRALEQTILTDRAQADTIASRVRDKGESLKAAVKAETGSEDSYLGTAEFEQAGLAKDIAEKAFGGAKGDVIGPVQTALGWHVLVLQDVIEPRTRPFAEVREDLRKSLTQARQSEQMFALSGQIDDGVAAGTPLEELATELGLKLEKFGPVRADGSTADNKEGFAKFTDDRENILRAAFEMLEGDTSPVMDLKDGSFIVVRTDAITPKSYRPFEDVRAELAAAWDRDQREVLNRQRADKALTRLQSGEIELAALARELNLSTRKINLVRAEDAPEPLNNASKSLLFEPGLNQYTLAPVNDGLLIGMVTDINIPDVDKAKGDEMARVRQNAIRGAQDEVFLMYLETLRKKYDVKINRRLLEQLYGQEQTI